MKKTSKKHFFLGELSIKKTREQERQVNKIMFEVALVKC